jgi:membrane protein implicated in regulation of membrane protease activity
MGSDFRYYVEYFVLAWTFRGFELPGFIWLFSIGVFVPLAVLVVALMRRRARYSRRFTANA